MDEYTRSGLISVISDHLWSVTDDKELCRIAEQFGIYFKPVGYGLFQEHSYNDGLDGQEEIIEELTND
jgi:hypothetical protein|tara:strand:- start:247 stop:450 length:204 start_codon:yes stop_codon:yes gene_type:complete